MTAALVMLFAGIGVALGVAYFGLLGRTLAVWLGGGSTLAVLALQFGRLALTLAVLALAAGVGWPALLASAAGVFFGRNLVLWRAGARPS
jgi:hypothetical protein